MDKIETVKNWLLSRVGNPYLMGGTGQPCTVSYRKARAEQYPGSAAKIRNNCPRMKGSATSCQGCRYYDDSTKTGKRAYDCAQLVRWAMDAIGISMVSGATSQWRKTNWAEMGEMDSLPAGKMVILYRRDADGKMGHTGIALGDGSCIHAKGHDYGVVREGVQEYGRWTHWGIPEGMYTDVPATAGPSETYTVTGTRVALRKGMTLQSDVIQRIDTGEKVTGQAVTADWTAVVYKGASGYMMSDYLMPDNPPGAADDVQDETEEPDAPDAVTMTVDKGTAEKLLEALKTALEGG